LTKSVNAHATIEYAYNADGLLAYKSNKIGGEVAHVEETGYDEGRQPLYKKYLRETTTDLSVGSASSAWTYNLKGQLTKILGYIKATTYEPDGQTARRRRLPMKMMSRPPSPIRRHGAGC